MCDENFDPCSSYGKKHKLDNEQNFESSPSLEKKCKLGSERGKISEKRNDNVNNITQISNDQREMNKSTIDHLSPEQIKEFGVQLLKRAMNSPTHYPNSDWIDLSNSLSKFEDAQANNDQYTPEQIKEMGLELLQKVMNSPTPPPANFDWGNLEIILPSLQNSQQILGEEMKSTTHQPSNDWDDLENILSNIEDNHSNTDHYSPEEMDRIAGIAQYLEEETSPTIEIGAGGKRIESTEDEDRSPDVNTPQPPIPDAITPSPQPPIQSHIVSNHASSFQNRVITQTITFLPEFTLPEDLSSYLNENIFAILHEMGYIPNFHDKIYVTFTSKLERLQETGEIESYDHHTHIPKSDIQIEMVDHWINLLITNLYNAKTKGSGWTLSSIKSLKLTIFNTERTLKRYGKYVPTPKKLGGRYSILNINTNTNCVQYSIIAHFMIEDGTFPKRDKTDKKHYEKNVGKYFSFPVINDGTVTIEDFKKIERATNRNIIVYQLKDHDDRCSIKIIRKSENDPNLPYIYLSTINEENHVVLITDIQRFIHNARKTDQTRPLNPYCTFCLNTISGDYARHITICRQYNYLQNIKLPDEEEKYKFRALAATQKAKYVAFYDCESILQKHQHSNILHEHEMCSYSYIIVDSENDNVVSSGIETSNDAGRLIDNILNDYKKLVGIYKSTWNKNIVMGENDWKTHKTATNCAFCNNKFIHPEGHDKHRHHGWDKEVIKRDGKVIKGNYIATLCFSCNSSISTKRYELPILAHNFSKYDSSFILNGLSNRDYTTNIISKAGQNIIQISVEYGGSADTGDKVTLRFIDSCSFLPKSLDHLTEDLKKSGHDFNLFKTELVKRGYSDNVIQLSLRKGIFPYEYIDSFSKLQESELPEHKYFFSALKDSNVSEEDYNFAQLVYNEANCKTIEDYMKLYLQCDVFLLAEVFLKFRNVVFKEHELDACQFLTLPSLAVSSALFNSKRSFDLLYNVEDLSLFESNIRGGLTIANEGYKKFNNPSLCNFDPDEEISEGLFLDFNSLYATVMNDKLPIGEKRELTQNEIEKFDIPNIDVDGDHTYCLLIDFEIPDDVKKVTDELPLGINHFKPDFNHLSPFTKELFENLNLSESYITEKLTATHFPQKEYLISIKLLQLYLKLGIKIIRIHKIFEFKQESCFRSYINKNINLRKNSKNSYESAIWKLMNNSVFGKMLFNARKNQIDTKLITSLPMFERYIGNPLLKEVIPLSENSVIIKLFSDNIKMKTPIYIGWYILQHSKYYMYNFFYNVLKKRFNDKINLMYTDTDSYFIRSNSFLISDHFNDESLKEHLDLSNYPPNHKLHSDRHKSQLGKLKSELANSEVSEICILQPKCYSILTSDNETKQTAKGINKCKQHEMRHDLYVKIHKNIECNYKTVECVNIRKKDYKLFTVTNTKRALSKLDTKRYWLDNTKSIAFGHPDIPDCDYNIPQPCKKRTDIQHAKHNLHIEHTLDLTARRSKPGRVHFGLE